MPIASEAQDSATEWAFVQDVLHDLNATEDREQLTLLYGQWRLAIKAFRRVEARRMTMTEPTGVDLLWHKALVTGLISFGTRLQIAARSRSAEELSQRGFPGDILQAILSDLQNTHDEWHAQIPEARIGSLTTVIFDVAPATNIKNS